MFNPFMVIFIQSIREHVQSSSYFHLIFLGQARLTRIHPGHQNPLQADWTHFTSCKHPPPVGEGGGGVKRGFDKGEALSLRRSATESGSRKNQNIPIFFWLRLRLWCMVYDLMKPDCPSQKQRRKNKPITMFIHTLCDWLSYSASASDYENLL